MRFAQQRFPQALMKVGEGESTDHTVFGVDADGNTIAYAKQDKNNCHGIAVIEPDEKKSRDDAFMGNYVLTARARGESIVIMDDENGRLEALVRDGLDMGKDGYRVAVFDPKNKNRTDAFDLLREMPRMMTEKQAILAASKYANTVMYHVTDLGSDITYRSYTRTRDIIFIRLLAARYGIDVVPLLYSKDVACDPRSPNIDYPWDYIYEMAWRFVRFNPHLDVVSALEKADAYLFNKLEQLQKACISDTDIAVFAGKMMEEKSILIIRPASGTTSNGMAALALNAVTDILYRTGLHCARQPKVPVHIVVRNILQSGAVPGLDEAIPALRMCGVSTVVGLKDMDRAELMNVHPKDILHACDTRVVHLPDWNATSYYENALLREFLTGTFTAPELLQDTDNILLYAPRCKTPLVLKNPASPSRA